MNLESFCANWLKLVEGEVFLAIGEQVAKKLNPRYLRDREEGKADSLPDLLSKRESRYRLREVKFKLTEQSARKAVSQLAVGAERLRQSVPSPELDRVEIVVPLLHRRMKKDEQALLGERLSANRYRLKINGAPAYVCDCAVTVLFL